LRHFTDTSRKGKNRMDYKEIIFEQKGNIAIATLNRPDVRNTVTEKEIIDEIVDACQRVQEDQS